MKNVTITRDGQFIHYKNITYVEMNVKLGLLILSKGIEDEQTIKIDLSTISNFQIR